MDAAMSIVDAIEEMRCEREMAEAKTRIVEAVVAYETRHGAFRQIGDDECPKCESAIYDAHDFFFDVKGYWRDVVGVTEETLHR